jgi:hypothetical protein
VPSEQEIRGDYTASLDVLQNRKLFAPTRIKNPDHPAGILLTTSTELFRLPYQHIMHENTVPYFLTSAQLLTGFQHLSFVKPFYNHGLVTNRRQ